MHRVQSRQPLGLYPAAPGAAFLPASGASLIFLDTQVWITSGAFHLAISSSNWVKCDSRRQFLPHRRLDVRAGIGVQGNLGVGSSIAGNLHRSAHHWRLLSGVSFLRRYGRSVDHAVDVDVLPQQHCCRSIGDLLTCLASTHLGASR